MRKPDFRIGQNKDADQLRDNREAVQRLVFATRIVQTLSFLNTKFQASSHFLRRRSLICVGPGRKPEDRFSDVAAPFMLLKTTLNHMSLVLGKPDFAVCENKGAADPSPIVAKTKAKISN